MAAILNHGNRASSDLGRSAASEITPSTPIPLGRSKRPEHMKIAGKAFQNSKRATWMKQILCAP